MYVLENQSADQSKNLSVSLRNNPEVKHLSFPDLVPQSELDVVSQQGEQTGFTALIWPEGFARLCKLVSVALRNGLPTTSTLSAQQ